MDRLVKRLQDLAQEPRPRFIRIPVVVLAVLLVAVLLLVKRRTTRPPPVRFVPFELALPPRRRRRRNAQQFAASRPNESFGRITEAEALAYFEAHQSRPM